MFTAVNVKKQQAISLKRNLHQLEAQSSSA
jgi:hypothetical protein